MKINSALCAICSATILLTVVPALNADDGIRKQILKLFPQADINGDGVISDAEEEIVSQQAVKRYPQADKDGDGVLSMPCRVQSWLW